MGLINSLRLREIIKKEGLSCSAKIEQTLEEELIIMLSRAMRRAKANQRNTVMPRDI